MEEEKENNLEAELPTIQAFLLLKWDHSNLWVDLALLFKVIMMLLTFQTPTSGLHSINQTLEITSEETSEGTSEEAWLLNLKWSAIVSQELKPVQDSQIPTSITSVGIPTTSTLSEVSSP